MSLEIIKRGTWLYDGIVEMPVDIICLNYDYWYRFYDDLDALEPNQRPKALNEKGVLYYVRFSWAGKQTEPTSVDSEGFQNLDQAIAVAESKVQGGINWQDTQQAKRGIAQ